MITQIRSSKIYTRVARHEVAGQFVRYATVGVLNVAVFFTIFNLLLLAEVHTHVSNASAFLVTSVLSFTLNKRWAFRDQREHAVLRQYFVFLFFTVVGLGLNLTAFSLFLIPLERYATLGKNLAALAALPFSVVWNFTSYRLWTFRHRGSAAA